MPTRKKKVVILGGGFAGLSTARYLLKDAVASYLCEITIIDAVPAHLYTPWLYEVATNALHGDSQDTKKEILASAAFPFTELPGFERIRFVQSHVNGLDPLQRQVLLDGDRKVPYDILAICLGSKTNYYGIPGLPDNALPLKRLDDAERIHDAVAELCKQASAMDQKRVVIVGAGANGIELTSELANTLSIFERKGELEVGAVNVTLIDPNPMFSRLPKKLQNKTARRFRHFAVELRPGLRAAEVGKGFVRAFTTTGRKGEMVTLPADLCIWTAGVRVSGTAMSLPFLKDPRGRLVIRDTLEIPGHPGIFAAGDCAAMINPHTGVADPQSAQVAFYQSKYLAKNIARLLKDRPLKPMRSPRGWAFSFTLGGRRGAGEAYGVRFWGYPAFLLRRLVDLRYFLAILPPQAAFRIFLRATRLYRMNDR